MAHEGQDPGGVHAATAALRASEERFRTVFELGPVAVYTCDRSGVIQEFNHRAAELWGRVPAQGDTKERFCGSFRMLRPDGTYMPHDQHPMAEVLSGAIPFVHDAEVRIERPDGSRVTVTVAIRPLKNLQGEITGAITCFHDITARKRTEEALLERSACQAGQKEALQAALNGAPLEASLGVLVRTAIERFGEGTRVAFYLTSREGTSLHHVVGMPDDYAACVDGVDTGPEAIATQTGRPVLTADVRYEPRWRPWLWLAERFDYRSCWSFPIHRLPGQIVATFAVYSCQPRQATERDVEFASLLTESASIIISRCTEAEERKPSKVTGPEREAALRRQKDQFTTLVEHIPDIVSRFDRNLRYLYISPAVETITGVRHEEYIGKPRTNQGVSPEYAALREELSRKVFETGEKQTLEFPIDAVSGKRHLEMRLLPEFAPDGSVESLMTLTRDVTERKRAEENQRLLLGELNHRVKNTLATIQAIAQQTLRRTSSPEQFVASFSGRVQALARAHTLLTNTTWRGADLRELIRDQVLLGPIDESRLTAWGPSITLGPEMALHMALVLHELATNSCKYGALSGSEGSVTVSWTVKGDELQLRWLERGGPPVSVSARRGFGSMMIEQSARAHQGSAEMLCEREGVSWTITLPLQSAAADPSTPPTPATNAVMSAGQPARAQMAPTPTSAQIAGKRVLVVEDEPLVAFDAVATVEDAGGEVVGPAGTVEEALRLIEQVPLAAALVDANLRGQPVDEIAAALARRNVPFAFMTGYDRNSLPQGFRDAAMLLKPYTHETLIEMIAKLVASRHRSGPIIPFRGRPDSRPSSGDS